MHVCECMFGTPIVTSSIGKNQHKLNLLKHRGRYLIPNIMHITTDKTWWWNMAILLPKIFLIHFWLKTAFTYPHTYTCICTEVQKSVKWISSFMSPWQQSLYIKQYYLLRFRNEIMVLIKIYILFLLWSKKYVLDWKSSCLPLEIYLSNKFSPKHLTLYYCMYTDIKNILLYINKLNSIYFCLTAEYIKYYLSKLYSYTIWADIALILILLFCCVQFLCKSGFLFWKCYFESIFCIWFPIW